MRNTTPLKERTCWCKCPVHLGQIGIEMEFILKRKVFRKDGCPGDHSQNRRVCKNVISMLPLRKVSSVYISCRMGLRKIAKIFPGGLGVILRISSFRMVLGLYSFPRRIRPKQAVVAPVTFSV